MWQIVQRFRCYPLQLESPWSQNKSHEAPGGIFFFNGLRSDSRHPLNSWQNLKWPMGSSTPPLFVARPARPNGSLCSSAHARLRLCPVQCLAKIAQGDRVKLVWCNNSQSVEVMIHDLQRLSVLTESHDVPGILPVCYRSQDESWFGGFHWLNGVLNIFVVRVSQNPKADMVCASRSWKNASM